MTVQPVCERAGETIPPEVVEAALRWLARKDDESPLWFLRCAIEKAASDSAGMLGCLVGPTGSMPEGTPDRRAFAIWGLLIDEIGKLGSAEDRRGHATLVAAFRLQPVPRGSAYWKPTLRARFRQLERIPGLFGNPPPLTETPMNQAWSRVLKTLRTALTRELIRLANEGESWQSYVEIGQAAAIEASFGSDQPDSRGCRAPSEGAQPVFLKRMFVKVTMRRRTVWRRITERDAEARQDDVDGYDVHALTGWTGDLADIPVRALWNCRLVVSPGVHPGDPVFARLCFGKKLALGECWSFESEAVDGRLDEEREWINVDVDHHGVARGRSENGKPVAGLTIRVAFDRNCLPEACWWYADQTENERRRRPPAGDPRLLEVGAGFVEHTFSGWCHPRESYGIGFRWPQK